MQQTSGAHLADERTLIGRYRAVQTEIPGEAGRRAEHPPGDQDRGDADPVERPHRLDRTRG